jgi:pimeloyl-ACP methyl ester carboxylesterase
MSHIVPRKSVRSLPKARSVLELGYRGYGRSGGRPAEQGLYDDSEAAYFICLAFGYQGREIVVYGEALGQAVAIDLAFRRSCAGLILEAPFTSASGVANRPETHSATPDPKCSWIIKGAGHNNILATAGVQDGQPLRSFYAYVSTARATAKRA